MSHRLVIDRLETFVREASYGSASDETWKWMKNHGIADLTLIVKGGYLPIGIDISKENFKQTVCRCVVIYSFQYVAMLGVYYNLAIGSSRLFLGCVRHIQQGSHEEISQEFEAAFVHFATAIYDFAIAVLFKVPVLKIMAIGAVAIWPQQAYEAHRFFFATSEPPHEDARPAEDSTHTPLERDCFIQKSAIKLRNALLPPLKKSGFIEKLMFFVPSWLHPRPPE